MKKIILIIGKIIISIILIIIIKILVHYFIFPSSKATFDINVHHHTIIKNPDFRKYDRLNKNCKIPCKFLNGDYFTSCKFRMKHRFNDDSWDTQNVRNNRKGDFLLQYPISFEACGNGELIDSEWGLYKETPRDNYEDLFNIRYHLEFIYIYNYSFLEHVINSTVLSGGKGNWRLDMSDLVNGQYVVNKRTKDIDSGFKSQSKLYLFIIPIYILLYWFLFKYGRRNKK